MIKVIVQSENGLHARPASALVAKASSFQSEITIEVNEKSANAKSIMNILGLGIQCQDEVMIVAVGSDSEEAEHALALIIGEDHD